MTPQIIVKRYEYEDPYHLHLEFFISNGRFSGTTEFYCNSEDLKNIGLELQKFPSKIDDEYKYEIGSQNPEDRQYMYFLLKAYIFDAVGHTALYFAINNNISDPFGETCRFSIQAEAASINHLGFLLGNFLKLEESEFEWSPKS